MSTRRFAIRQLAANCGSFEKWGVLLWLDLHYLPEYLVSNRQH
jgi:hypothetical protein